MRKILITLLLLVFISHNVYAQAYFNKRVTVNSFYNLFSSVKQVKGNFYVFGSSKDSGCVLDPSCWQSVKFVIFDSVGNTVRDTIFTKEGYNLACTHNYVAITADSNFIMPLTVWNDTAYYTMLTCIDTLGNVLWTKDFHKPVCTDNNYYHTYDLKPTGTGEWLMLSHSQCYVGGNPAYRLKMLLTKLDNNFNIIWNKLYGVYQHYNLPGTIMVDTAGYVIGGAYNNQYSQNNLFSRAELVRVDTAGNELWSWTSEPTKFINRAVDVIRTQDGGYIYAGQGEGEEQYAGGNSTEIHWRVWIEKLDANRNVVWNRVIAPRLANTDYTEPAILKEMPDGNIIRAGTIVSGYGQGDSAAISFASLVKLNANGDMIWQRQYNHFGYNYCYHIYDMQQTTDGGFVMVGEAYDCEFNTGGEPKQRGWIIKVDSNGCEQSSGLCNPTEVAQAMQPARALKVYPNPANDLLYIEHGEQNLSYRLVNVTGTTVLQGQLPKGMNRLLLHGLAPGMYILHAGDEVHKVIKE